MQKQSEAEFNGHSLLVEEQQDHRAAVAECQRHTATRMNSKPSKKSSPAKWWPSCITAEQGREGEGGAVGRELGELPGHEERGVHVVEPSSTIMADRVACAENGVDESGPLSNVPMVGASGQDGVGSKVRVARVAMKEPAPHLATDNLGGAILALAAERTSGRGAASPGGSGPSVVAKKDASRRNAGRGVRRDPLDVM